MIKFYDTEKSINRKQIEEIENIVNLKFPDDYIEHLLKYNGGRCEPNEFSFHDGSKMDSSCIHWFLAIYDSNYDSLLSDINTYKISEKRMPIHIFPIANDPLGNCICISCKKDEYGYVYFWDHEQEVDYTESNDNDYSNLFFIADSFSNFLNNLYHTD